MKKPFSFLKSRIYSNFFLIQTPILTLCAHLCMSNCPSAVIMSRNLRSHGSSSSVLDSNTFTSLISSSSHKQARTTETQREFAWLRVFKFSVNSLEYCGSMPMVGCLKTYSKAFSCELCMILKEEGFTRFSRKEKNVSEKLRLKAG